MRRVAVELGDDIQPRYQQREIPSGEDSGARLDAESAASAPAGKDQDRPGRSTAPISAAILASVAGAE